METITALSPVTDLERFHNELRAALMIAGREIRRLHLGERDYAVRNKLRATLPGRSRCSGVTLEQPRISSHDSSHSPVITPNKL